MTTWIGPEAVEHDERRELFTAMTTTRPWVVAVCGGPEDVREALERAARDLLPGHQNIRPQVPA